MNTISNLDRLIDKLFVDDQALLSDHEKALITRCNAAFTVWLEKPMMSDLEIVNYLMSNFNIGRSQAYQDIVNIKYLLGNVHRASKEFHRWKVLFMIDEAYEIAKAAKDGRAMAALIDKLGKYTKLDQEDPAIKPWNEILPQPFEPTSDPSVIGLKPISNLNQKIEKLKKKYMEMIDIEDVTYERPTEAD